MNNFMQITLSIDVSDKQVRKALDALLDAQAESASKFNTHLKAVKDALKVDTAKPIAIAEPAKEPAKEPAITKIKKVKPTTPPANAKTLEEDVKKLVSKHVGKHRDAIVSKMKELGASKVSKLKPENLKPMFDFLETLS